MAAPAGAGGGHDGLTAVRQQLAALSRDVAQLNAQLDQTYQDLWAEQSTEEQAACKQRYEYLQGELKSRNEMLKALWPQLTGFALTEERARQLITEAVQQAHQEEENVEPKAFSNVGSTEAEQLLQQLGIGVIDGHAVEPIQLPADTPGCSTFDFAQCPDESEGTPALLKHHEAQLRKLGVKFGRNNYTMFDLNTEAPVYRITTAANTYQGTVDGCVAPFGLTTASALNQCRVAYLHKQSPAQKQAYRDAHPEEALGPVGDTGVLHFAAACKGQTIAALLGAYAYNAFPLMVDLTDGEMHNVLRIQGNQLVVWTNLSATQAYYLQAQLLNDAQNSHFLTCCSLLLEALPEELQQPMKKLRALRPF